MDDQQFQTDENEMHFQDKRNLQSKNVAEKLLGQGKELCIIGLTGKIKSGMSDVCKLLTSRDFCDKVTQPANTAGFSIGEIFAGTLGRKA